MARLLVNAEALEEGTWGGRIVYRSNESSPKFESSPFEIFQEYKHCTLNKSIAFQIHMQIDHVNKKTDPLSTTSYWLCSLGH